MTMSKIEALSHYKKHTPVRAGSKIHAADIAAIRQASRPLDTASNLVGQRKEDRILARIDHMLVELQGKAKRYRYDQTAAIQLEHLQATPLDPITQAPIWRDLLCRTKGKTVTRKVFLDAALAILSQESLYTADIG